MKYKTTTKAVNEGYANKIRVGYCNLQHLLQYESPTSYTTRWEGWAADIYEFGDVAIITGYVPFGNIRPAYDICKRYEKEAEKIQYDYSIGYDAQKEKLSQLIKAFIEEVTQ